MFFHSLAFILPNFQQFLLKRMSVFSHKMFFIKNEAALLRVISGTVQGHLQQQSSVQLFDVAFSIKKSTTSHHQPKYTHHHPPPTKIYPPPPTTTHLHPSSPTTSQNIPTATYQFQKNGPPPRKSQNIFIEPLFDIALTVPFSLKWNIPFRDGDFAW